MNKTQKVCSGLLKAKIVKCHNLMNMAESSLKNDDFLQCAVYLESIREQVQFDPSLMDMLEAVSEEK